MHTVKDLLARKGHEVACIEETGSILEAARLMNDRRIGSLVVIRGTKVVGILTERDVLRKIVAEQRNPATTPARDIMTSPVACCHLTTSVDECRAVMTEKRIRRLPVVEEGELRGIITIGDVFAWKMDDHESTIEYLTEYLYQPPAPHG